MDAFEGVATERLNERQRAGLVSIAERGGWKEIFPAGSAAPPPLLAGRQAQRERINALLAEVYRAAERRSSGIVGVALHGPRGTGKTVLLNAAVSWAVQRNGLCLDLTGLVSGDEAALVRELRAQGGSQGWGNRLEKATRGGSVEAEMPLVGRVKAGREALPENESERMLEGVLAEIGTWGVKAGPLLIVIDEAHLCDPALLGRVMGAVQAMSRGNGCQAGFLLAGTPDLVGVLDAADQTWFVGRGEDDRLVPVGNLTDAECYRAVAVPLEALGLGFDEAELREAAGWCKGSPYFTQALGRAALLGQDGGRCDFSKGSDAEWAFAGAARRRYESVFRDLHGANMVSCARQIGALWRKCNAAEGVRFVSSMVEDALDSGLEHPLDARREVPAWEECIRHFTHLGLLWQPDGPDGDWELGLPSFFDYTERHVSLTTSPRAREVLERLDGDAEAIFRGYSEYGGPSSR